MPLSDKAKEDLYLLVLRWKRVWKKHNSHREHKGTRRKGKK